MLPPRSVFLARSSAGAFALAAALSLWNGTTEWTAAGRGLAAAVVCALLVPTLYGPVERAWAEATAKSLEDGGAAGPAPNAGNPRP